MKLKIDSKIFEKFQSLNIGVVIAKNIDNKGNIEEIQKSLREKENEIWSKYLNKESF